MKYDIENQMLDSIEVAIQCIEYKDGNNAEVATIVNDIREMLSGLNIQLFTHGNIIINIHLDENASEYEKTIEGFKYNVAVLRNAISRRETLTTDIDIDFYSIIDYANNISKDVILNDTIKKFINEPTENVAKMCKLYNTYTHFWGTLDIANNDWTMLENRINLLVDRSDEFVELYEMLGDYRSKNVLMRTLRFWIGYAAIDIVKMCEGNYIDYFDHDILHMTRDEVMVDCGAFIGDSAEQFISSVGDYKKIICYEMDERNFGICNKTLSQYKNIEVKNKGVGSENKTITLTSDGGSSVSLLGEVEAGKTKEVEIVRIDDDIKEKITMLKMDIEGAEKDALLGARNHIMEDKPKLLICVYHGNTDYLDIPKMIKEMRPDYKFYLRSNGQILTPAEIVLFAV